MAAVSYDGLKQDVDTMDVKSEETVHRSSGNTDNSILKRWKVKASSSEKGNKYSCKECGKQMIKLSNLKYHIRSIHEGIKYPCGQCQHEATSKGNLTQHRRTIHE